MIDLPLDIKPIFTFSVKKECKITFSFKFEIKNESNYRILEFWPSVTLFREVVDSSGCGIDNICLINTEIWLPNTTKRFELNLFPDIEEFKSTPEKLIVHFKYEGVILDDNFSGEKEFKTSNDAWKSVQKKLGYRE